MISNRRRRGTVAAVLFASWLASTACSNAIVRGPPPGHERMTYIDCESRYSVPTQEIIYGVITLPAGGIGALFIASGIIDMKKVTACHQALASRDLAYSAFLTTPVGFRADASIASVKVTLADTLRVGQVLEPRAVALNQQGVEIPGRMFQWASSDTIVLALFGSSVRAKAGGVALLAATTGGVAGSLSVVVVP